MILPPPGGADRKAVDRLLRAHRLSDHTQTAVLCGLVDVAKRYVSAGVGVALMYVTGAVVRDDPGLRVRPLGPDAGPLPIEMAVRKGAHRPDYVEEFRAIARHCLADRT